MNLAIEEDTIASLAAQIPHCLLVGAVKGCDQEFPVPQNHGFFGGCGFCCGCCGVPLLGAIANRLNCTSPESQTVKRVIVVGVAS